MTSSGPTYYDPSDGSSSDHPGPPRGDPVYSAEAEEFIDAIQRPRSLSEDAPPHKGRLPPLDLPSFGTPEENCGKPTPGSMWWCPDCAGVHQKKRVCNRYDCPLHWAHAVRRRAAGSNSGSGVAPQLDALRRYLNAYRDDNQYFHHLVYSPPRGRLLEAKDPLKKELEVVRELMDVMGIQGLVAFHPWAGKNEDIKGDDRGQWKRRIGKDTEWRGGVREELQYRPHFHIVGVAPFIDLSETPEINEETDAVLHRITQEDSNVSIEDDEAMCRAVTYALSHAGIYNTPGDQRRLAAWMKGPDVHRVTPMARNKARIQALVYDVASDTLGIAPPDLTCDEEVPPEEIQLGRDRLPDLERPSEQRGDSLSEMYARGEDPGTKIGAHVDQDAITVHSSSGPGGPSGRAAGSWSSGHVDGVGGMASSSSELPPGRDDFGQPSSSGTTTSTSSSSSGSAGADDSDQDVVDDEPEVCGAELRHISKAGEYLLDPEWRTQHHDEDVADLEAAYRSYVDWMTSQGLDPAEDPNMLPEEREDDRPPDD